jgi:hypothetical protein
MRSYHFTHSSGSSQELASSADWPQRGKSAEKILHKLVQKIYASQNKEAIESIVKSIDSATGIVLARCNRI